MKFLVFTILGVLLCVQVSIAQNRPQVGTLTVNVSNVQHRVGNLKAVLQNRSIFLTPQFIACIEIPPTGDEEQMIFKNLPFGDYAVMIYHDLNTNDFFDRNLLGYPLEPFAVSNNLHILRLLRPSFDAVKITLSNSEMAVNINLLNN